MCEQTLDKFILLFSFVKLAIVQGKTVVICNDIIQAYRIKLFLNRFSLKAFVLAPDMPKNQIGSIIHFFHIGQFDIVIMLHTGYSIRPVLKDVGTIINFDIPSTYNSYKESA
jgi:superfamily II DNA/RNA helicase